MSDHQPGLRFDIYERVHLPEHSSAIDELDEVELTPQIQVAVERNQAVVKGALQLVGTYSGQAEGEARQTHTLEHRIPVEITLPISRVRSVDAITVEIENFDIDLLSARSLNVTGVLSLNGIELESVSTGTWTEEEEVQFAHEPTAARIEPAAEMKAEAPSAAAEADKGVSTPEMEAETDAFPLAAELKEDVPVSAAESDTDIPSLERSEGQSAAPEPKTNVKAAGDQEKSSAEAPTQSALSMQAGWIAKTVSAANPFKAASFSSSAKASEAEETSNAQTPADADESQQAPSHASAASNATNAVNATNEGTNTSNVTNVSNTAAAPTSTAPPAAAQAAGTSPLENSSKTRTEVPEDTYEDYEALDQYESEQAPAHPKNAQEEEPKHELEPAQDDEPDKGEMKIAFGSKKPEGTPLDLKSYLSKTNDYRKELAAPSAPASQRKSSAGGERSAEAQEPPQETAAADVLEWKNLFLSANEEQQFRKVRLCIVHKDDTLETIAQKYDRKPQEIRLYNSMGDQEVTEGQVIYIP